MPTAQPPSSVRQSRRSRLSRGRLRWLAAGAPPPTPLPRRRDQPPGCPPRRPLRLVAGLHQGSGRRHRRATVASVPPSSALGLAVAFPKSLHQGPGRAAERPSTALGLAVREAWSLHQGQGREHPCAEIAEVRPSSALGLAVSEACSLHQGQGRENLRAEIAEVRPSSALGSACHVAVVAQCAAPTVAAKRQVLEGLRPPRPPQKRGTALTASLPALSRAGRSAAAAFLARRRRTSSS